MTRPSAYPRKFGTLLLTALVFAAVGCNGKDNTATDSANAAGTAPMRVALLTPGAISDQGWNGGAYNGLLAIRDSLGAEISHIQTKTPAEFDENFRQYGAQNYLLVFGHGFEYQDAAVRIAPQFPKTVYVVTSGRVVAPNVAGVAFAFEQASYQAGILAGAMTKSNTIGLIAGTEIPPVKASFTAFERGAKSVNAQVKVLVSYIGNWEDVSAGKELALTHIRQGADIIFQNADAAGLGIFQAAKEKKVLAFGANANQNQVAPDVVIASVVIDLPKALLMIAREVKDGAFKGRVIDLGVSKDVVRLEINPAFSARIPANITAAIDSVGKQLKAGTFRTLDDLLIGTDSAVKIKP
ncbi:MAG: BMP family protein [Phycisphaerae bacterium]|nr:BMP family protein [Gemmatimonadaceae bacterium]